ncbi:MAG: hypothetical protein IT275_12020 [Chitinophagales bacterium]|nr:hypothetical protein [Chitinophagales bacterium]HMV14803.1 hypothetical protein [Chitinophagales bacterium]HMW13277.1 hypothetical protein [Chitinophagales bacterium]HMX60819.1 hypothetical protein [Chitinophagales bacterium]HMY22635.1 hypothetical protein [Chitinophagales bacterium]
METKEFELPLEGSLSKLALLHQQTTEKPAQIKSQKNKVKNTLHTKSTANFNKKKK